MDKEEAGRRKRGRGGGSREKIKGEGRQAGRRNQAKGRDKGVEHFRSVPLKKKRKNFRQSFIISSKLKRNPKMRL